MNGEGKGEPGVQSRSLIPCQLQISRVWECSGGLAPFKACNLNSRARERSWVQTSPERLSLPWVCSKLGLFWSQPCGGWRLLPVLLFWRYFWGVWNRGKVSGTRMRESPNPEKHRECFGDVMACCDIPVLSESPKMPHSRTRLRTANGGKDLKSSEAAEVDKDITRAA